MSDDKPPAATPPGRDAARRAQLAARALAQAKQDAWARGERRPGGGQSGAPQSASPPQSSGAGAAAGGEARGRQRRDDPQSLRAAIEGLVAGRGWQTAVSVGSVFGRWEQIVGPELAAHTRPEAFDGGQLVVAADSTAWATQVRLLAAHLVRRLNSELGHGAVTRVVVRGPAAPSRGGPWRLRGARGPRDDYG